MAETTTIAKPRRRRWLGLSLRALMVVVVIIACLLARVVNHARMTREVAAVVTRAGGTVQYDWEYFGGGSKWSAKLPRYSWLHRYLPPEFFEEIVTVELHGPNSNDAVMAQVGRVKGLQELTIEGTSITAAGLSPLRRLKSLRALDYTDVKATGAGLVHMEGLTHLRKLSLFLDASDADLLALQNLTSLEDFTLVGINPRVTDAGLQHLAGARNVRSLDIRHALITSRGLAQLKGLSTLKSLVLDDVRVESLEPFRGCRSLQSVSLSLCPVESLEPLRDATDLESLELIKTKVVDSGLQVLDRYPKLQRLLLPSIPLKDETVARIGQLTQLRKLNLNGSFITDEGAKHLAKLSLLTHLGLEDTRITEESFSVLELLPHLQNVGVWSTKMPLRAQLEFEEKILVRKIPGFFPPPPNGLSGGPGSFRPPPPFRLPVTTPLESEPEGKK